MQLESSDPTKLISAILILFPGRNRFATSALCALPVSDASLTSRFASENGWAPSARALVGGASSVDFVWCDVQRQQRFDVVASLRIGQFYQQHTQIPLWMLLVGLGGLQHTMDHHTGMSTSRGIGKKQVLSFIKQGLRGFVWVDLDHQSLNQSV